MKVQIINKASPTTSTESGSKLLNTVDFTFSRQSDGAWKCVVPVKLPNSGADSDTRNFVARVPITIKGERTVNRDNRARIMLKVAMPYTALSPDVADDAVVANQFDMRRSGGELTAHVVLSAPASLVDDYKGNRGSTCERAAVAQVNGIFHILGLALGPLMSGILGTVNIGDPYAAPSTTDVKVASDVSTVGDIVTTENGPTTKIPRMLAIGAARGETPTLDLSEAAHRDAASPISQGLLGGDVLSSESAVAPIALFVNAGHD